MASRHTSQDFNFQYYVDRVKQKEMHWHVFVKLVEDLSYLDVKRLKYLNAILLTELTVSYSVMDQLKYLNVILMGKFKDFIQIDDVIEVSRNTNLEVDHDLNDKEIKELSSDGEIQISGRRKNEIQENFDLSIHKFKDFINIEDDTEISENEDAAELDYDFNEDSLEVGEYENMEFNHDLNDETIKEIHSDRKNEKQENNFIKLDDDVQESENEDCEESDESTIDHDTNNQTKKDISIARENEEYENFESSIISNKISIGSKSKGHKDCNCKSCGKSFSLP